MTSRELFDIWAPHDSIWSDWAKPVCFAQMDGFDPERAASPADFSTFDMSWAPDGTEGYAILLDLDGVSSVWMGAALITRGYRPVPLFNACSGGGAVVETGGIIQAIAQTSAFVARHRQVLPDNVPPAFLLDSRRLPNLTPRPGQFDNRWMVFPQDFPSANFLLSHSIRQVLLVQEWAGQPREDLAHVLLRWQEAGVAIFSRSAVQPGPMQPTRVIQPPWYRFMWHRFLAASGLRPNSAGGFGSVIPIPSQSGGYGSRGFG